MYNDELRELKVLCRNKSLTNKYLSLDSISRYDVYIVIDKYDQSYSMTPMCFLINGAKVSLIDASIQEIEELGFADKHIDGTCLMKINFYDEDENDTILPISEEIKSIIYDAIYDTETESIFLYGSNIDGLTSVMYTDQETNKLNTKVKRAINKILVKLIALNLDDNRTFTNNMEDRVCAYYGIAKKMIMESESSLIYFYDENNTDKLIGKFIPTNIYLNFLGGFIVYSKENEELVDRVVNHVLNRSKNYSVFIDICNGSIFIRKPKEIKEDVIVEYKDDIVVLPKICPNTLTQIVMSTDRNCYMTCDLSDIDGYNISDIKRDVDRLNNATQLNKYCIPVVMKSSDNDYLIIGKAFNYSPYIPETSSIKEWGFKIQWSMFWMMYGDNDENILKEVADSASVDSVIFKANVKLLVDKDGNRSEYSGINNLEFLGDENSTLIAIIIDFL